MHELCKVEAVVRVECSLVCLLTFTVLVVSVVVPIRAGCVEVSSDVVRNVCDEQLRRGDVVPLVILEVIPEQLAFHISHWHPPASLL